MYRTLAFRNMKRQLRNYLIYFVTIAMTISLVFAMNNMIYNEDLQNRAEEFKVLFVGLLVLSGFLCVIIAIVLGYANAFLLRLRKREFGTYLTLGMKRHQMMKLFILENSFLGIIAIVTGFVFGSLLYQGLMLLMSALLQYEFEFSFVSLKGVWVTFVMAFAIFVVSFVTSSIYLKRVKVIDLIHGEKQVNKVQRKPVLSALITVISAAGIIYSVTKFPTHLEEALKGVTESGTGILYMLVLLALSIIAFHIGLAKCLMYGLLNSTWLRQKGTNLFVLRQLSATLSSNALLLGLLAFLITFAIITANMGFIYKAIEEESIERRFPFELMGNEEVGTEQVIPFEEAVEMIEQYTDIHNTIETPFFSNGQVDFLSLTSWYTPDLTDTDVYMRESDLNKLLEGLGEEPIKLEQEYAIYSNMPAITEYDFSKETIEYNGQSYRFSHVVGEIPAYVWAYLVIVVPDELVEGMEEVQKAYAFDLASTDFDVEELSKKLTYEVPMEEYVISYSNYRIKSYEYNQNLSFSAIFIVGALYLGFVFILLAMAILALKTLSGISEDAKRYRMLNRIGVAKIGQTTTLMKQIFLFFAFPVVIPIVLSIPIVHISNHFIQLLGYGEQLSMTLLATVIVTVIVVIYLLYFIVTFTITKKHVLP